MKQGWFITFEGPDGSGKTTQIHKLKEFLDKQGYDTLLTREPGGTIIGEKIRSLLLNPNHTEMDSLTEALLYAASRAQHVQEVIKPALQENKIVICDRFVDSSIAYQGYGRCLGDKVKIINEIAVDNLAPDLTFLLVIEPRIARQRIINGELDRLEMEKIEYHNRVYNGYIELSKQNPERILLIDGSKKIEDIKQEIVKIVAELILENKDPKNKEQK